jgi:hypothetical protein
MMMYINDITKNDNTSSVLACLSSSLVLCMHDAWWYFIFYVALVDTL